MFEGFSNSIGEAICSGRPVICSDVSDNSVMVQEENGFLFNPTDEADMLSAFIKLLNTPIENLHQMGIKSRERAEQLFNVEKFTESYISLIES